MYANLNQLSAHSLCNPMRYPPGLGYGYEKTGRGGGATFFSLFEYYPALLIVLSRALS